MAGTARGSVPKPAVWLQPALLPLWTLVSWLARVRAKAAPSCSILSLGSRGNEVSTTKQLLVLLSNVSAWDEAVGRSCFRTLLGTPVLFFLPDSRLYQSAAAMVSWSGRPAILPTQAKETI